MDAVLHAVGWSLRTWYDYTGISFGDALVLTAAAGILGGCVTSIWERLNGAEHPTP